MWVIVLFGFECFKGLVCLLVMVCYYGDVWSVVC